MGCYKTQPPDYQKYREQQGVGGTATDTSASLSPRGLILEELLGHQTNLMQRGLMWVFFFPSCYIVYN